MTPDFLTAQHGPIGWSSCLAVPTQNKEERVEEELVAFGLGLGLGGTLLFHRREIDLLSRCLP